MDTINELEELGLDTDINTCPLKWHERMWLKYFPYSYLNNYAKRIGAGQDTIDLGRRLFEGKNIDLYPLSGCVGRGFIIAIDRNFTIWFYQNGDHFEYDGFEMGEYGAGDVTIFDKK